MTNFEKITASPEALDEFLASLTVATGPWDEEFHRAFCDSCERENCDEGHCPHQDKRYNPLWWLMLGGKEGEAPGLTVRIKAAFPILWNREYYTVAGKRKETRAPCVCCDNTGKVTIKGVEYPCPRCKGNWREKEVVGETTVYSVAKWVLKRVDTNQYGTMLTFEQTNSTERYAGSLQIRQMVDIKGLDKARVLKALYDHSHVQGSGFLQAVPDGVVTVEHCEMLMGRQTYFDYLHGRVMKVDLSGDEFDERLYDRDCGEGAAQRAVDSIRAEREDGGDTAENADGEKKELTMDEKAELSRTTIIKILEMLKELPPDVSEATCTMLKMTLPGPIGGMAGLMMMGWPFSPSALFRSVEKPMGWPTGMGPRGRFG